MILDNFDNLSHTQLEFLEDLNNWVSDEELENKYNIYRRKVTKTCKEIADILEIDYSTSDVRRLLKLHYADFKEIDECLFPIDSNPLTPYQIDKLESLTPKLKMVLKFSALKDSDEQLALEFWTNVENIKKIQSRIRLHLEVTSNHEAILLCRKHTRSSENDSEDRDLLNGDRILEL